MKLNNIILVPTFWVTSYSYDFKFKDTLVLLSLLILFSAGTIAQKAQDSQIIISLSDTIDLYKKVKIAMVNADFIVKDNYNLDTLTTYSRELTTQPGHCVAVAILKKNKVIISGFYSLKKMNLFGYTRSSANFEKIHYYKGSNSWNLLMQIAEGIGGEISFSK